jgi:hypothetical protein
MQQQAKDLAKLSLALAVAGLMAIMTAFSGSKAADIKRSELIGLFDAYRPGLLAFTNPCYEIGKSSRLWAYVPEPLTDL